MLALVLFVGDIIPVINRVEQEIKELIGYYKFTIKQRVQASNHLESIKIKDGSLFAIKDLEKEIKNFTCKEKVIITKIKEIIENDKNLHSMQKTHHIGHP